jgi:chorismate mutase
MATKINEGDVMEGIFSLACALYIAYGKIDKAKLNILRTQIEPERFRSGRVSLEILKSQNVKEDTLSVDLQIRLKPGSVTGAFGKDFAMYVGKSSDIGALNAKIDTLIRYASSSAYLKRLEQLKEKYISNKESEVLRFNVIADGVEGEQSGGDIKGDVLISLEVEDRSGKKILAKPETVSYSIKSGSKTAANLSPYAGMLAIAKHFSVNYKDPERYRNVLDRIARTDQEKKAVNEAIQGMFNELREALVAMGERVTDHAIEYIRYNVQGSDQAFLVDLGKTKIKEIPSERSEFFKMQGVKLKAM